MDNAGSKYEKLLQDKYKSSINRTNYNEYFESFKKDISNHIIKKHWDELGKILENANQDFFNNYFNKLSKIENVKQENIKERFSLAGIEV